MTARGAGMALTITRAETHEDLEAARTLIRAFVAWALENVAKGKNPNPSVFANLEAEIAGEYRLQNNPATGRPYILGDPVKAGAAGDRPA